MIVGTTTLKDTPANVRRFVENNLRNGVDHLFVYLDAPQPRVREFLEGHPHVTCIRTDADWWAGERPSELNIRQQINANVTKCLLSAFDWVSWVFHIDGDEVMLLDRDVLAGLDPSVRVVRLALRESVARLHADEPPTTFKRILRGWELRLLVALGVLDEAKNGVYFHGHVSGKVGIRPCTDLKLSVHHVREADGENVPAEKAPNLLLLHYESYSGDDFVRKWEALVTSGDYVNMRPNRDALGDALASLLRMDLAEEVRRRHLETLYRRFVEDDVETLQPLGLLEEHDPTRGTQEPRPFPEGGRAAMESLLHALSAAPKSAFALDAEAGSEADALARALAVAGSPGGP